MIAFSSDAVFEVRKMMSRELNSLSDVLMALCELEKSTVLSAPTRDKISTLKLQLAREMALLHAVESSTEPIAEDDSAKAAD